MKPVLLRQAATYHGSKNSTPDGVTLFLDFDGVLHPHPCNDEELFGCVHLLEALLHVFPEVEIVISSAWRKYHSMDVLKARVGVGIANRIVGATPVLLRTDPRYSEPLEREREIELWMGEFRGGGRRWVALDDWPYHFELGCKQLVLTDPWKGLTPESIEVLRKQLMALRD